MLAPVHSRHKFIITIFWLQYDDLAFAVELLNVNDASPYVEVEEGVLSVRPYLVCCTVHNLSLTPEAIRKFLSVQVSILENSLLAYYLTR